VSSGRAASPAPATHPAPRWLAPTVVIGIVVLDQITKSWVVASLSDGPLSLIGDDVELRLTRNSGGAFSLFTNATVFLALMAIVLSLVLVRAVRRAQDLLSVLALSLVLGGALGNLVDRIFRSPGFLRGHVVDYVKVGSFPSFNVADSAITIGAILLIIASLRPVRAAEPGDEHPA
jgi:signal peptidase II